MELETSKVLSAIKSVIFAASTDVERPHLHAVQMWHTGDRFGMAATNGHWLAQWEDIVAEKGDAHVTIDLVDAKFLLAVLGHTDCERVDINVGSCMFNAQKFTVQFTRVDDGPDVKKIFRERQNGQLSAFGIDPRYIGDAAKAFKAALNARDLVIEVSVGPDDQSPLLLTCPRIEQVACIVMPCRLGADGTEEEQERADVDKQRTIDDAIRGAK